ncbi:MAG: thioredoxin family protein [Prolixibacteraceae bacterium]|nr:thioredoxin family protein [Prolixibacteraceae bacterium]MBN2773531.1 thioredoxin family protein [Prolixibacteraceae bacterium]
MKNIESLLSLTEEIKENQSIWLLLYKTGSDQSECAYKSLSTAAEKMDNVVLLNADVNKVRDIHPHYHITSVPALLQIKNGLLVNTIKGCHKPEHFKAIFENSVFISSAGKEEQPVKRVTVYSTPTCSWCITLKRHLDIHGIRYRDVDVSKDQKAAEDMVRRSGQQGVPQTDINGQMIVGFDKNRINNLLGIN